MNLIKTWFNGKIVRRARVHAFNQSVNWGVGIYEGIKIYKTERYPAIFRLDDHLNRLFYSASVLNMKLDFSRAELKKAILQLVQSGKAAPAYIRISAFFEDDKFGINFLCSKTNIAIGLFGLSERKAKPLKLKISPFRRISNNSTVIDAKLTGNYTNSALAFMDAKLGGFDDAILLDTKGYVAESAISNVFMIKGGIFYTPKKGSILPGITRDTVIKILKKSGESVIEADITPGFLKSADSIFLCGTSKEITPVNLVDKTMINRKNPLMQKLEKRYKAILSGKYKEEKWLTYVK